MRDLMVIYILTNFGADWLIFVDASVLTRKLWVDRQTDTDGRCVITIAHRALRAQVS